MRFLLPGFRIPLFFTVSLSIHSRFRLSGCNRPHRSFRSLKLGGSSPFSSVKMEAGRNEKGSVAKWFWIRSQREAIFAAYSPFVVCLAAGNLEVECFRNYIAQDVHFLKAFARAYTMVEECIDDADAKAGIRELREAVMDELKMHNSVVEEWGVDPTKDIVPIAATIKYINFLLATAEGKVEGEEGPGKFPSPDEKAKAAAYTLGAMTPCMRLYSSLGKKLQMFLHADEKNHPYKNWIENYASKSFEAAAEQIEELLDKATVSLPGEKLEVVEKLYSKAMKLEIEFFSAQPIVQPAVVPLARLHNSISQLMIFSDFDLTCTIIDSSALLAEIAVLAASRADPSGSDDLNVQIASDLKSLWDTLSRRYTKEYAQCIESILASDEANKFDYERLHKALEQFSDFEKQANSKVIKSRVLHGMEWDDIKRAGKGLNLQDGCKDFFEKVASNKDKLNADIHVLSFCWCADLIRSAFSSGPLNALNVHANEFEYEGSVSTGKIIRKIESPLDKVETFKLILNNVGCDEHPLSIYIGDSVGDILCLLEADVGIVIGSSTSLRRVGTHFGVSFVPLLAGLVAKQKQLAGDDGVWKGLSGVLYTVSSWSEVQAFILGE